MWHINDLREREFELGQQDWAQAALLAQNCRAFVLDDEDEWAADEDVSCYNCYYRRWTRQSFVCCRPESRLGIHD